MCGICGRYSPRGVEPAAIERMAAAVAHRGPDEEGFHVAGPIGLGCRRLSIIDLEGGRQPIANEDRTVWVVHNGEIYNYRDLRRDLERRGHAFATRSDTEVLVHLYEELGAACVEELRGMFAFALWDARRETLLLARDRLGQKPLFYAEEGGGLTFASEVKGILAADGAGRELDPEALHHYLSLRFIPPPATMLAGIRKLPAAHYLVFHRGSARLHRYWEPSFAPKLGLAEDELLELLGERLREAVAAHLVSDVPVGAFLSGGLDSSTVVALAAPALPGRLKTFSIGVREQGFDELPHARQVAARYGTDHTEETVSASLVARLPAMVWHLDEPSDPIAACMEQAAALAARQVKVALGGDGGDELFAGFDRYLGLAYVERHRRLLPLLRTWGFRALLGALPESFAYKSWSQRLRWLEQLAAAPDPAARYAAATCFFRFRHQEKLALLGESLARRLADVDSTAVIRREFERRREGDLLDRMLAADYLTRLPEHSLMLTDRMGMAHGLEVRSPFLDHGLVELLAAFPSALKIRGRTLKFALRRFAADLLPPEIVRRPKQGFTFPFADWFRDRLHGFLREFLSGSAAVEAGIFRPRAIERLLDEHRRRRIDHHVRIWLILSFEVWFRIYVAGEPPAAVTERILRHLDPPGPAVSAGRSQQGA